MGQGFKSSKIGDTNLMETRKLTFQEVWDSSTVFFVDDALEDEIDEKVAELTQISKGLKIKHSLSPTLSELIEFLEENIDGLDVVLRDIGLSDEKFLRIISLLRKIGRIPGEFDREWTIIKVKRELSSDLELLQLVAKVLFEGKNDLELSNFIPRYYLDKLNYREISTIPQALREIRFKESTIGTYGARKGHRVESKIGEILDEICGKYGLMFEKGRSRIINVDIDFAIPSLQDPWAIIMCSFQETTSSGQTTKARDMLSAYTKINESNSRFGENRAFVNFVDGGGWLARKRDLERLVEQCHYFVNFQNLNLLEGIILQHVPHQFFH